MRPPIFVIAAALLMPLSAHAWTLDNGVMTCYVAPDGDDSADGNAPAKRGQSAPFATLSRAIEAAKTQAQTADKPLSIQMRGGFYLLDRTVELRHWKGKVPLSIEAYQNETPVLSAATRLQGWKQIGPNRWQIKLPEVAAGRWNFEQLSYNGERRFRPALPADGYFLIDHNVAATAKTGGNGNDKFGYRAGDFDPRWSNRADMEIEAFHVWTMSRMRIGEVDETNRDITFAGQTRSTNYQLATGGRFRVVNVKEALHWAGQWYLDRPTGVLTYLAQPGENPNRDRVLAPRLERVVQIENARDVSFRGLTFTGTNVLLGDKGYSSRQGEVGISSAVEVRHARGLKFHNCNFENLGGWGVDLGLDVHDSEVVSCRIRDLGAGGVKIGTTEIPADAAQVTGDNRVEDCVISSGGRVYNSALGVWIGHAGGNRVAWNEIGDFYYTGISVGWTWGYGPSVARNNIVEHNHIHHIGQNVLSDMGGIYTLGIADGSRLIGNRIHDVAAYNYGGWGIYFDEGTTNMEARDNLVTDCDYSPFDQHYGTLNRVENNIFAGGHSAQMKRTRGDNDKRGDAEQAKKLSFSIQHNIFYWEDDAPLLASDWRTPNFVLDSNVYWSATALPMRFPGNQTLAQWRQSSGQDVNSVVRDPQFVAPEKGDFRLKNLEAARQIGFVPFEINAGSRVLPPMGIFPPRAFPIPPDPNYWRLDPEDQTPGRAPRVKKNAIFRNIVISDQTAASGRKSLAFEPGKAGEINVYPGVDVRKGELTSAFALRLSEGTQWSHGWNGSGATKGPKLTVADGKLSADGAFVTDVPADSWMKIRVICPLGLSYNGRYQIAIAVAGEAAPRTFELALADSKFGEVNNWNFTTPAPDGAAPTAATPTVWMDDIVVGPNLTN